MKNRISGFFRILLALIKVILWMIWFVLTLPLRILNHLSQMISDRLRFSITFKITMTYVFLFLVIFSLMSIGIIASFNYFIITSPPADFRHLLVVVLGVFNLIGLGSIVFFGSRASCRLLAPVKTMTQAVQEISIHELNRRLDVSGAKDELKDLAITFNDMLDRFEKSVEQQNRFVSDASHELRTPIAVVKGYADLLDRWGKDDRQVLEESVAAIQSEAESMNSLLEKLLFLARGDKSSQKIDRQSFPLAEMIEEIIRETRLIAPEHQILNDLNEEINLVADRKLIKEAVRIFMDNSIKFTPAGGSIKLNAYRKDKYAVISIEDTGIGIARADLPYIFDRFYRADQSRTKSSGGTGLGLSIAKWIIDSNQGEIRVWSDLESGTVVRIALPL